MRRRLEGEAARFGVSLDALALAGVLARPWVDVVLSGAAAVDQLRSNLAALTVPWDHQTSEMARGIAENPEDYWNTRAQLPWN
jgi:aryl-alcohol dehydrogenase-like predicted oxidoreductase